MTITTLHVENVPHDLYKALRERARASHRSIATEVVALLEQNIPTENEPRSRRTIMRKLKRIRLSKETKKRFPSTEEMQRLDRKR